MLTFFMGAWPHRQIWQNSKCGIDKVYQPLFTAIWSDLAYLRLAIEQPGNSPSTSRQLGDACCPGRTVTDDSAGIVAITNLGNFGMPRTSSAANTRARNGHSVVLDSKADSTC